MFSIGNKYAAFRIDAFLLVITFCSLNVGLIFDEFIPGAKFNLHSEKQVNSCVNVAHSSNYIDVRKKSKRLSAEAYNASKIFVDGRNVKFGARREVEIPCDRVPDFVKKSKNPARIRLKRELCPSNGQTIPSKPTHSENNGTTETTDLYHGALTLKLGELWFDRTFSRRMKTRPTKDANVPSSTTDEQNTVYDDTTKQESPSTFEEHEGTKNQNKSNYMAVWYTTHFNHRTRHIDSNEIAEWTWPKLYILPTTGRTVTPFRFPKTPRNTLYDDAIKMKLGNLWFAGEMKRKKKSYPQGSLKNESTQYIVDWLTTCKNHRTRNIDLNEIRKWSFPEYKMVPTTGRTVTPHVLPTTANHTVYANAIKINLGKLWFGEQYWNKIKNRTTISYISNQTRRKTTRLKFLKWEKLKLGKLWFTENETDEVPNFYEKYHDPLGWHGQETHPIYGRYGSRFLTKWPMTKEPDESGLRVAVFTRAPNQTLRFTYTPYTGEVTPPGGKDEFKWTDGTDISDISNFYEKYYDPKGYHGQETHPLYGRYGPRLTTLWPITREPEESGLWVGELTRDPNVTWRFSIKTAFSDEITDNADPNVKKRLRKTPTTLEDFIWTDAVDLSDISNFSHKFYDPLGWHGQETHPIYGRYGSRFSSKWPLTREPDESFIRVKVLTRGPNHTFRFSYTPYTGKITPDASSAELYNYSSEIDSKDSKFYEKYYDPKGFHGQETHPFYGRFGPRFTTKFPYTVEPTFGYIRVKEFTRAPGATFKFTMTPTGENDVSYYSDESESAGKTRSRRSIDMNDEKNTIQSCGIDPVLKNEGKCNENIVNSIFDEKILRANTKLEKSYCSSLKRWNPSSECNNCIIVNYRLEKYKRHKRALNLYQAIMQARGWNTTTTVKRTPGVSTIYKGKWTRKTVTQRTKPKTTHITRSIPTFNWSYLSPTTTRRDWRSVGLPEWIWNFNKNSTVPDYMYDSLNSDEDSAQNYAFDNLSDSDFCIISQNQTWPWDHRFDLSNPEPGEWGVNTLNDNVHFPEYIPYTTLANYSPTTEPSMEIIDFEKLRAYLREERKKRTTFEGFIPPEEYAKYFNRRESSWQTVPRIYATTRTRRIKSTTTTTSMSASIFSNLNGTYSSNQAQTEQHTRIKRLAICSHTPLKTPSASFPSKGMKTFRNIIAVNATTVNSTTSEISKKDNSFRCRLPELTVPSEGPTMGFFYTSEYVDKVTDSPLITYSSDENTIIIVPRFKRAAITHKSYSKANPSTKSSSTVQAKAPAKVATVNSTSLKTSTRDPRFWYKLPVMTVPSEGPTLGFFYTGEFVDWPWVKKKFGTRIATTVTPDSVERAWEEITWSDESPFNIVDKVTDHPLITYNSEENATIMVTQNIEPYVTPENFKIDSS